jgi:hypothetical protein
MRIATVTAAFGAPACEKLVVIRDTEVLTEGPMPVSVATP